MALAETTVVNGQRRLAKGIVRARCCSKSASSRRGQEPSGCDHEKYATMGEGIAALVKI
jgi:hypothetical protein